MAGICTCRTDFKLKIGQTQEVWQPSQCAAALCVNYANCAIAREKFLYVSQLQGGKAAYEGTKTRVDQVKHLSTDVHRPALIQHPHTPSGLRHAVYTRGYGSISLSLQAVSAVGISPHSQANMTWRDKTQNSYTGLS